jgi:hypothetical protein
MAVSKSRAFQSLDIDDMLPLLASSYEAGRLVPFIGAGMSRPKLAGWDTFVDNLEKITPGREPDNGHLEIRAQRAAATIRNSHTEQQFWEIIAGALKSDEYDRLGVPEQTDALASIYWPLTVSTNYDHLFYCACRKTFPDRLPPMIVGRGAEDCKQVISGLVSPFDRELIWHIQGFLGEPCPLCNASLTQDPAQLDLLRRELVIGHSEYRKAANTAVHFRRCFGEVFGTRSFLFLGSSLSEEYFWNLFGETLELCGPSPVPHFAFLPKSDKTDIRFLAEEMNITVCEYKDYDDLSPWLQRLKAMIEEPSARISRWHVQLRGGSSLDIEPYAHLPMPEQDSDSAIALVVRACSEGRFDVDHDLLGQRDELLAAFKGQVFPADRHVLSPQPGLFAVRARTKPATESESDSVGAAIRELLGKVGQRWSTLHLHLPSAGGTVPPVYGFIESVRAFGNWARASNRPLHLISHVGPQVLLNLTSRQVSLHELLTSELIRFWTVVNAERGREPARRVLYREPKTPLKEVLIEILGDMDDEALKRWSISICPSPRHTVDPITDSDLCTPLRDVGIVLGSVITLTRVRRQEDGTAPLAHGATGG